MSNNPTHPPPRFDADTLEDMRHRLPEYLTAIGVELRRQGARLVGKCPTHDDSSPSFAVLPNGKTCGCYPCDFQGDIFAASQWMGRSDSFTSAVRDVADTLGIYLPDSTAGTATKPATAPQRPAKPPEPPFELCAADRAKIHAARLALTASPKALVSPVKLSDMHLGENADLAYLTDGFVMFIRPA